MPRSARPPKEDPYCQSVFQSLTGHGYRSSVGQHRRPSRTSDNASVSEMLCRILQSPQCSSGIGPTVWSGLDSRSGGPQTPLRVARGSRKTVPQQHYLTITAATLSIAIGYYMPYRHLAKNTNFTKRSQQVICYQCGRVAFWATSSVRTAAECNVGREQVKPAARAADIFCLTGTVRR